MKVIIILQLCVSLSSLGVEIESQITVGVGKHPNRLVVADLNNDGNTEIIVSNHLDGSVTIIKNIGGKKGHQSSSFNVGSNPTEIVLANMNDDNFLDIVIANHETSSFRLLLNDKEGAFKKIKAIEYPVETVPHIHTLGVGDFNQDQINDVVIDSWGSSEVAIYYLNQNGKYIGKPTTIRVREQPRTNLVVTDIDGDTLPDIITPATRTGGVTIIFGKDLASTEFVETSASPFYIAIADTNLDGYQDIITVHRTGNYNNERNEAVTLLLGSGKGQFELARGFPIAAKGAPSSVSVGDIDGDGWPEIITANYRTNSISIIQKEQSSVTYKLKEFIVGRRPEAVVVADIDNDNISEVIVANRESNNISILKFTKTPANKSLQRINR